ncbi:carbohydrate ABC transporter membrane protein 2, CUT1 family [Streptomyces zhaozhouensis]|uniref:Carbohydrate ABC transporter membrane protein 2, CUT1 family n=1 Tax=Streptomyces zhaozhouensis TaxID=1300267 RepID=A0A286DZV3_9ACTN|nr:carbohydrate ABC transporter permease [Streptomyces zhaozhouensis]SOD64199.1 carbohydrate ABC transporter membrane protein 2, CUT1 family [Streptomyces zhaozhouensis]
MRTLVRPAVLRTPRGRFVYWSLLVLALVLFTVAFILPLYWMVTGGLKSSAEVARNPPTYIPEEWHPGNYADTWDRLELARYFGNTVVLIGGAWLLGLAIQLPAAYALSKLRPRFGRVVLGMMLLTLMVPATALLIPTYLTVTDVPFLGLNLVNNPAAVWLPAAANAFNIYVLKNFFDQIPGEILDAARIDGAGALATMWRVILPLSRPIIAVVSILSITALWRDFLWPMVVLPDPAKQPITVYFQRIADTTSLNMLIAGMVLASIPLVVVFLVFQRHILAGLTAGSLKG